MEIVNGRPPIRANQDAGRIDAPNAEWQIRIPVVGMSVRPRELLRMLTMPSQTESVQIVLFGLVSAACFDGFRHAVSPSDPEPIAQTTIAALALAGWGMLNVFQHLESRNAGLHPRFAREARRLDENMRRAMHADIERFQAGTANDSSDEEPAYHTGFRTNVPGTPLLPPGRQPGLGFDYLPIANFYGTPHQQDPEVRRWSAKTFCQYQLNPDGSTSLMVPSNPALLHLYPHNMETVCLSVDGKDYDIPLRAIVPH
jgi:hypothetical protein